MMEERTNNRSMRPVMRTAWLWAGLLSLVACQWACKPSGPGPEPERPLDGGGFDAALADRLGADAYGMKQYVMAFLRSGPHPSPDSATAARLQRAHLDNIRQLAEEGKLLLAGPFLDTGSVRGIYVFDVRTLEEARALTETDPSIQAGALEMELRPWYGSAALMQLNALHQRVQKKGI